MRVAIVGSRHYRKLKSCTILKYLPKDCDEIISGGAKGVDFSAKKFALENNIKYTEFLPNYHLYDRAAPLIRNKQIVDYCDYLLAFWDHKSTGTKNAILHCVKSGKKFRIITI